MKLHFQFALSADDTRRAILLRELERDGARLVRPLFPGETDPELAAIQVVESDETHSLRLLQRLKSSKTVQYAEMEPVRKLVR